MSKKYKKAQEIDCNSKIELKKDNYYIPCIHLLKSKQKEEGQQFILTVFLYVPDNKKCEVVKWGESTDEHGTDEDSYCFYVTRKKGNDKKEKSAGRVFYQQIKIIKKGNFEDYKHRRLKVWVDDANTSGTERSSSTTYKEADDEA